MLRLRLYTCCVVLVIAGTAVAEPRPAVIQRPKFDPDAARIELFDGLDQGLLTARLIPHDETRGAVFVENLAGEPLTVELPPAFIGVQVLPQIDLQIPVPPGFANGVGPSGSGATNSGNQPVGSRATTNGPTGGPQPTSFFSIPAERVVRIEFQSVCLRQGAATPNSGNVYRLVRVEQFSSDPRLPQLLARIGKSHHSQPALQAAAWHLSDGLSWEQIAQLTYGRVNAPDVPQFSAADLRSARKLLAEAAADVESPAPVAAAGRKKAD